MKFKCPYCKEKSFTIKDKFRTALAGNAQCKACGTYVRLSSKIFAVLVLLTLTGSMLMSERKPSSMVYLGVLVLWIIITESLTCIISPFIYTYRSVGKLKQSKEHLHDK